MTAFVPQESTDVDMGSLGGFMGDGSVQTHFQC